MDDDDISIKCDRCGTQLKCLCIDTCPDHGEQHAVAVLECPSCLDQDEFTLIFDDDQCHCLVGHRHREHGYGITEEGLAFLERID